MLNLFVCLAFFKKKKKKKKAKTNKQIEMQFNVSDV